MRFFFEKESVTKLRDMLREERKKRKALNDKLKAEGKKTEEKDVTERGIIATFASKEDVIKKLLNKYLQSCVIQIGMQFYT